MYYVSKYKLSFIRDISMDFILTLMQAGELSFVLIYKRETKMIDD